MGRWFVVILTLSACAPPRSLPIRVESFTYTSATLSQAQILNTVLAEKVPIGECAAAAHRDGLSGKVIMVWDITPEGRVEKIAVRSPDYAASEIALCLADTLRTWRFPAAEATTSVAFPFKF